MNGLKVTILPNGGVIKELADGIKIWYLNGEYHREDGPAVIYPSGSKYWYLNNKRLSEQEFLQHPIHLKWKRNKIIEML